jgi:hypothetical protein
MLVQTWRNEVAQIQSNGVFGMEERQMIFVLESVLAAAAAGVEHDENWIAQAERCFLPLENSQRFVDLLTQFKGNK